jgi:hypothetical protein
VRCVNRRNKPHVILQRAAAVVNEWRESRRDFSEALPRPAIEQCFYQGGPYATMATLSTHGLVQRKESGIVQRAAVLRLLAPLKGRRIAPLPPIGCPTGADVRKTVITLTEKSTFSCF